MKIEDIVIPISIATGNQEKLASLAEAIKEMGEQQFDNLERLADTLSQVEGTSDTVAATTAALVDAASRASQNFSKLSESVRNITNNNSGVKGLGDAIKNVGKNLVDVKGFAVKVGDSLGKVIENIAPLSLALKLTESIGSAITAGFSSSIDALKNFNAEVGSYSELLSDEKLGKALAEDMRELGDNTLFTREAISNAAKTLLSYGATSDETRERMNMFAEVAGGSSQGLEKLAEVYAKTESSNRVALEDLEALRDMGIDISDILASEAGVSGDALFKMASQGKIGFKDLSAALNKATKEGAKFYKNTAREAKTLEEAQAQTAKMGENLFLSLGQALEPLLMSFEKVKQLLLVGLLAPVTKIVAGVVTLLTKLTEVASFITGEFVKAFKSAFDPIFTLFAKVAELAGNLWGTLTKFLGFSKKELKEAEAAGTEEPARLKKYDPTAITDYDKQMMQDYEDLQKQIFKLRREAELKPYHEQLKAAAKIEALINAKNKEFIAKYSSSFDRLSEENQKTLAGVEKTVSDFAKANHDFVAAHKTLKEELAEKEREILTLPYREQEKASRKLAEEVNSRNKEFLARYSKNFASLNESSRQVVVAMEREVNEFEKTALDRSFAASYKELQDKITSIRYSLALLPEDAHSRASAKMQAHVSSMYKEFVDSHKDEFEKLNDSNRSALLSAATEARKATKGWLDSLLSLLNNLAGSINNVLNQDLGKSFAQSGAKGADALVESTINTSRQMLSSLGVWGGLAAAVLDFTIGIFKGIEANAIEEIEKKRDKDLERLAKQSEVDLARLEEGFDREINMRKEKLSKLDEQYNKEIDFIKQAQAKGQISGEEFQKRLQEVQAEYSSRKETAKEELAKQETSKKVEIEREKKLGKLEEERIKAQAELDKVNASWWSISKKENIANARKILEEILRRISTVKAAGSLEEIKLARKGAFFKTSSPTYIPQAGLLASEMGQPELVRVTPAPIEENLRLNEAALIAKEITRLQRLENKKENSKVIINNYNFTGDVLDAEKLVRMLKEKEHSLGFRMQE
ncbi:tape measure protein (plasmid) [Borrelia sp. A-FGy1]|uniref:tape measure protein n=1 Tax=Borrelia sp. A-FGy1 TaxID=2608247 RepID=UPI0015F529D3|nr:tape measure protein [Borrelia sp. A-FGy1]QMU99718.1 tape measure protein [Borrelia sp. A-FGy1]